MADFSRYVITNKGRQLIAKVSSNPNDSLVFTKFETSDKKYEVEELPPLLTLAQIKQSGNVTNITNDEEEYQYKINGSINTLDLEVGYFLQTIGLYAKSKVDNEEILFAITTTIDENKADWVSENGAMNTSQILLTATFIITNADVKSVIVNVDGYTPITTFVEHAEKTKNVHGATSEATVDKIIIRDDQGSAKIKYPTNPADDSIVNKKAVEDRLIKYKNDNTNESNVINYWKEDKTYKQNDVVAIEGEYTNPATQRLESDVTAILFYKALKTTTGNKPGVSPEYWKEIKTAGDLDKNLVLAKDVQYDIKNSNLTIVTGFSFPKIKNNISTFNIYLNNGSSEDQFVLSKENEKSYKISGRTSSNRMYYEDGLRIKLTSFNTKTSFLDMFEQLSIFYPLTLEDSGQYIDVEGSQITISEVPGPLKYQWFINNSNEIYLFIKRKDDTPLSSTKTYTVTLTEFKNKRFENLDLYVHFFSDAKEFITLKNIQNERTFSFNSNYTNKTTRTEIELKTGSKNFLRNYIPSEDSYKSTNDIKVDSYKDMKYKFYNNTLYIKRNDGANITNSNAITIKINPVNNRLLEKITKSVENVQELGLALTSRAMIPAYYTQYTKRNGTFIDAEAPNIWYSKMYGIDTTWELLFNGDSVTFITEGSYSNDGRSSGIQSDAIRNITGKCGRYLASYGATILQGALTWDRVEDDTMVGSNGTRPLCYVLLNASSQVPTAQVNRMRNRLIRVYHLISINGVYVNDIIGD